MTNILINETFLIKKSVHAGDRWRKTGIVVQTNIIKMRTETTFIYKGQIIWPFNEFV